MNGDSQIISIQNDTYRLWQMASAHSYAQSTPMYTLAALSYLLALTMYQHLIHLYAMRSRIQTSANKSCNPLKKTANNSGCHTWLSRGAMGKCKGSWGHFRNSKRQPFCRMHLVSFDQSKIWAAAAFLPNERP